MMWKPCWFSRNCTWNVEFWSFPRLVICSRTISQDAEQWQWTAPPTQPPGSDRESFPTRILQVFCSVLPWYYDAFFDLWYFELISINTIISQAASETVAFKWVFFWYLTRVLWWCKQMHICWLAHTAVVLAVSQGNWRFRQPFLPNLSHKYCHSVIQCQCGGRVWWPANLESIFSNLLRLHK